MNEKRKEFNALKIMDMCETTSELSEKSGFGGVVIAAAGLIFHNSFITKFGIGIMGISIVSMNAADILWKHTMMNDMSDENWSFEDEFGDEDFEEDCDIDNTLDDIDCEDDHSSTESSEDK